MSDSMIRNCPWGYSCKQKWRDLIATYDEGVRFCADCQRDVHWVDSRDKLAEYVLLNRCVSFNASLIDPSLTDSDLSEDGGNSFVLTGLLTPDILDYEPAQSSKKGYDGLNDFDDDDIPF